MKYFLRFRHRRLAVDKCRTDDQATDYRNSRRDVTMPYSNHPIAPRAPFVRSVAIAALLGATMLATPLTAAWAQTPTAQPVATATEATQTKGETVEPRITK